jgi:integrase
VKMPNNDKWTITESNNLSCHFGKIFRFDFSYIKQLEIKELIKNYIWRNYRGNNRELATLCHHVGYFKHFMNFAKPHGIESLRDIENSHVDLFLSYLNTVINKKTGNPLTRKSKKNNLDALKSIVRWGQLNMPEYVPKGEIFTGSEFIGINRKSRIQLISDEGKEQICNALFDEKNVYVKSGIILLRDTAMRISDLLGLKTDCIQPHKITGDMEISWWDYKNRKLVKPRPASKEVRQAVKDLIEYTDPIRRRAPEDLKKYLMLYIENWRKRKGRIKIVSYHGFREYLKKFIKKNHIKDTSGELLKLTPHMFKRTLASDMANAGKSPVVIFEILNHSSYETSLKHYVKQSDKAYTESLKGFVVGSIDDIAGTIKNKIDREYFEKNKNKLRLADGYCTKPVSDPNEKKLCKKLINRTSCYQCKRFVTTPEYLGFLKEYKTEMESSVSNNPFFTHYKRHFERPLHLIDGYIKKLESYNAPTVTEVRAG